MTKRFYLLLLTALIASSLHAEVFTVADSIDRQPLPGASIFNRSGIILGITDEHGAFSRAKASDYPLTIQYLGYAPASMATCTDSVLMRPTSLNLSEVTVSNNVDGVHLTCYLREYCSAISSDTTTVLIERMVDFLLPLHDKVKKFKTQSRPRTLAKRSYARFVTKNGGDSVATNINTSDYSWIYFVNLGKNDVIEEPASLRNVSAGTDTIATTRPVQIYRKTGGNITITCDYLADKENHLWSPNILKLAGATTEFDELSYTQVYPANPTGKYHIYNLAMHSFAMQALGKGKLIRKAMHSDKPVLMRSLIEVYPVDCCFITAEESRALAKEQPATVKFTIPESAAPLDAPTQALIDRLSKQSEN